MPDLRELYKRSIFDHNRNPRNFHEMENASHSCDGYNPLCGDKVHVYIKLGGPGTIEDISFTGSGCAIFKASASFMTDQLKGKAESDARKICELFMEMVKGDHKPDEDTLGKLSIFQGVREFPSRVKCATLAWHALVCALDKQETEVKSE